MKENEVKTWHILFFTSLVVAMIFMIYDKPQIVNDGLKTNCKDDSLRIVIHDLNNKLIRLEKENDELHNKFSTIIFEYNFGLEH